MIDGDLHTKSDLGIPIREAAIANGSIDTEHPVDVFLRMNLPLMEAEVEAKSKKNNNNAIKSSQRDNIKADLNNENDINDINDKNQMNLDDDIPQSPS